MGAVAGQITHEVFRLWALGVPANQEEVLVRTVVDAQVRSEGTSCNEPCEDKAQDHIDGVVLTRNHDEKSVASSKHGPHDASLVGNKPKSLRHQHGQESCDCVTGKHFVEASTKERMMIAQAPALRRWKSRHQGRDAAQDHQRQPKVDIGRK